MSFTGILNIIQRLEVRDLICRNCQYASILCLLVCSEFVSIAALSPLFPSEIFEVGGIQGSAIVAEDFNSDGWPDVAVANSQPKEVRILLGSPDKGFAPPKIISSQGNLEELLSADLNGDGIFDLVATGGDRVSVWLGMGRGDFDLVQSVRFGDSQEDFLPDSLAVADFDRDGTDEISFVEKVSEEVWVLKRGEDGEYRQFVTLEIPDVSHLRSSDFNGDGYADLVAVRGSTSGCEVLSLVNSGDGGFVIGSTLKVSKDLEQYVVADFNNDSLVDLVVLHGSTVDVYLGDGAGVFTGLIQTEVVMSVHGFSLDGISIGDFNQDNNLDLVTVPNWGGGQIILGDGLGRFIAGTALLDFKGTLPYQAVDFNRDGWLDVISLYSFPSRIALDLGDGKGGFPVNKKVDMSSRVDAFETKDFDGDGRMDFVSVDFNDNTVRVFSHSGEQKFEAWSGVSPRSVVAEDFNEDAIPDIAIGNAGSQDLAVFLGKGDGSFGERHVINISGKPVTLATMRINQDDFYDLVVGCPSGAYVCLGDGQGQFSVGRKIVMRGGAINFVLRDFNLDGHVDFLTGAGQKNSISVHLGDGTGEFADGEDYGPGFSFQSFLVDDLNEDSILDIAGIRSSSGKVSVVYGLGRGRFDEEQRLGFPNEYQGIVSGDFNSDGISDLVTVTLFGGSIAFLAGNGNGFDTPRHFRTDERRRMDNERGILMRDVDADGVLEIIVINNTSVTIVEPQLRVIDSLPVDLEVSLVSSPSEIHFGRPFTLEYEVKQTGDFTVWRETIYLSEDEVISPDDRILFRNSSQGRGQANDQDIVQARLRIPYEAALVGRKLRLLVGIDSDHEIQEIDETNNIAIAELRLSSQITRLQLDQVLEVELENEEMQFFTVDAIPGQPLVVSLERLSEADFVGMYVGERMPQPSGGWERWDSRGFIIEKQVYVPEALSDQYIIALNAISLKGTSKTLDLQASIPDFGIETAFFGRVGNAGDATVRVSGYRLDGQIRAHLQGEGNRRVLGRRPYVQSPSELFVTFDLRGIPPGIFDVVFENGQGGRRIVTKSLRVVDSVEPSAAVPRLFSPDAVRREVEYTFGVEWQNQTLNDMAAPVLRVLNSVPIGISSGQYPLGMMQTFPARSSSGPPGVLMPGAKEKRIFWTYSGSGDGNHQIAVQNLLSSGARRHLETLFAERIRVFDLTEKEVERIYEAIFEPSDQSHHQFWTRLAEAHSALGRVEDESESLTSLMDLVIKKARADLGRSISGHVVWSGIPGDSHAEEILLLNPKNEVVHIEQILSDGSFIFEVVEPGEYRLEIEGYLVSQSGTDKLVVENQPVKNLEVQLTPGLMIRGSVVSAVAGIDLSDLNVFLFQSEECIDFWSGVGDADFSFGGLKPGSYRIAVRAKGFAFSEANVTLGELDEFLQFSVTKESIAIGDFPLLLEELDELSAPLIHVDFQEGGRSGSFPVEISGSELRIRGLPRGEFELIVAIPGQVERFPFQVLSEGANVDLGTVLLRIPPSDRDRRDTTFSPEYISLLEDFEAGFRSFILPSIGIIYGRQARELWRAYVSSSPAAPASASYSDGSSIVERRYMGFRSDKKLENWLQSVFEEECNKLKAELGASSIGCEEVASFFSKEIEVTVRERNINLGDPLSIPGLIAGGTGRWDRPSGGSRKDQRELGGTISARSIGNGNVRVESKLWIRVTDTVDFCPGDLGTFFEKPITLGLKMLEKAGRAHGVPYYVTFHDHLERFHEFNLNEVIGTIDLEDCDDDEDWDDENEVDRPAPFDPNDIVGPRGVGDLNFVSGHDTMLFTIRFENDPEKATAPANSVVISQILDDALDLASIELGRVGIGNLVVVPPRGVSYFQDTVDFPGDTNLRLFVSGGIDVASRELRWEFLGFDRETGWIPENPFVGILPPNTDSPLGEGFVEYLVRPDLAAEDGTRVDSEASIVFDVNEPIRTEPIFHTLDFARPVFALRAEPGGFGGEQVVVALEGNDFRGSGIKSFDIEVASNNGNFQPWMNNVGALQHTYEGHLGERVVFRVIAEDRTGHRSDTITSSEIIVTDDDYIRWREIKFAWTGFAISLKDPVWGDDADPDADGRSNLEEFIVGSEPLEPDVESFFVTEMKRNPMLDYPTVLGGSHQVSQYFEWSSDGKNWNDSGVNSEVVIDTKGLARVQVGLTPGVAERAILRARTKRDLTFSHWFHDEGGRGLNADPLGDENGDGYNNLVAYAFGLPLFELTTSEELDGLPEPVLMWSWDRLVRRAGIALVELDPKRTDLMLFVESSRSINGNHWERIATKEPSDGWRLLVGIQDGVALDYRNRVDKPITLITELQRDQGFYRVSAQLIDPE